MGFYLKKLQEYKKGFQPYDIEERLLPAKEKAEGIMHQQYEQVLNEYRNLTSSPIGVKFSAQLMGSYQQQLAALDSKIREVEEMSVPEYFSNLIGQESEALNMFISSKGIELSTQMRTIGEINSSQPFTTFYYGIEYAEQAEERANNLHTEALCSSALEQEGVIAKTEWEEMPTESKLEYLVGRIENENIISFDQAGINELGQTRFENLTQEDVSQQ